MIVRELEKPCRYGDLGLDGENYVEGMENTGRILSGFNSGHMVDLDDKGLYLCHPSGKAEIAIRKGGCSLHVAMILAQVAKLVDALL
jgi:hypothetical protein